MRLVHISDELAALADACHEPARADEPYRRALRVDPRPADRDRRRTSWTGNPNTSSTSDCSAYVTPA